MQAAGLSDMRRSMTLRKSAQRIIVASRRYGIEAVFAAALMFCIEMFVVALEHPASPVALLQLSPWVRRTILGGMMGGVVAALCASPWGKRSGAHINPAITLARWTLGLIKGVDALVYVAVQAAGALGGVLLAAKLCDGAVAHPAVGYAVTRIQAPHTVEAFFAESGMAFILMSTVLWASSLPLLRRYTPALAGATIALFVTVEAPLSGMSINPARTFSAGLAAGHLEGFWLYLTAPCAGMLLAARLYQSMRPQHHGKGLV